MRRNFGKRMTILDEGDVKKWTNTRILILEFLQGGEAKFGTIFQYVNSKIDEPYSRKGFSLKLENMVDEGDIRVRRQKQGHFLYSLTKKGQQNIGMIAQLYSRHYSTGLLRVHFEESKLPRNMEQYFLKRTVTRIGLYLVCACIEGGLQHTSIKNSVKENQEIMHEWIEGINPSLELVNYLADLTIYFEKFSRDEEAETPVFNSRKKLKVLKNFQKLLEKMYPNEFGFLKYRKEDIVRDIRNERNMKKLLKGKKLTVQDLHIEKN